MLYIQIGRGKKVLKQDRTLIRMTLPLQVLNQFFKISSHNLHVGQKSFRILAKSQLVTNSFEVWSHFSIFKIPL